MNLNHWVDAVRGKLHQETYVDFHAIPDPPEGPYRARAPAARFEISGGGAGVSEPEIVLGEVELLYLTRCPCGRQWVEPRYEAIAMCPKCGRTVVVTGPKSTGSQALASAGHHSLEPLLSPARARRGPSAGTAAASAPADSASGYQGRST